MRIWVVSAVGMAAAWAMAGAAQAAAPLAFNGVELGTSKAAWLALKTPASASAHARRACSDEAAGAAAGLTAQGLGKGAVVCAVVDTYGRLRLPVTFTWERRYPMDHVSYVFTAGRLRQIRAVLPADAFDAVVADFKRSYGAPSKDIRDQVKSEIGKLPRATLRWATPAGSIELVDPSTPGKLSVRLTAR